MTWRHRCLDAVARRTLPVCPGDMVFFTVSRACLFVAAAKHEVVRMNELRRELTTSQELVGFFCYGGKTELTEITLDWVGYQEFWTNHR